MEEEYNSQGMALNLLPDERIICKAQHGLSSLLGPRSKAHVIATNKRFIISGSFGILSSQTSIFYDKIAAIDVKRNALGSKLIIHTSQSKEAPKNTITFFNQANALTVFSIISNQIAMSKDPEGYQGVAAKIPNGQLHHKLERPARIESQVVLPTSSSVVDRFAQLARKVIEEPAPEPAKVADAIKGTVKKKIKAVGADPRVRKARSALETAASISNISAIAHKMQSEAHVHSIAPKPNQIEVEYFSNGKVMSLKDVEIPSGNSTVEIQKTMPVVAPKAEPNGKFNPDKDMKIFRIRNMRDSAAPTFIHKTKHHHIPPLNIFNVKD